MKLLRLEIEGLTHFQDTFAIDFVAQQRVDDNDKEQLYNILPKIYENNVIAFVGVNASGKTTILKAVSFVIKMLNNEPINHIGANEILADLDSSQQVIITSYFYQGNCVNKLKTIIGKKENTLEGGGELTILDEMLWSKESARIKTKKGLYDFRESDLKEKRDQNQRYLMHDVSIMVAVNKQAGENIFVRDMLEWTDHNILNVLGKFPQELLTFLDPAIEYLECSIEERNTDIRLKFYGKEEIIIHDPAALGKYLSSGTIKGLGVFMSAVFAFVEGGYLIVDEIENHFNREIVATLIRFFWNSNINKNGAVLIFSTHYSELLDEFDRNDGIYIVKNRGGITAQNLAQIYKRNDIKRSELYDSDYLGGTVPEYEAYMALKKVLIQMK